MAENKKKNTKKNYVKKVALFDGSNTKFGAIEYKMNAAAADSILRDPVTGNRLKGDPQTLLCDYVNEQLGLLRHCVRVVVE